MRAVVQRVSRAEVRVGGRVVGAVGRGLLVLLGVGQEDDEDVAVRLASRIARMRLFPDAAGKLDRSIVEVGGGALVVSQFTLLADLRRGTRPSFTAAAAPDVAQRLYGRVADELAALGVARVETGRFGAHMDVDLVNDGPVTIVLDVA